MSSIKRSSKGTGKGKNENSLANLRNSKANKVFEREYDDVRATVNGENKTGFSNKYFFGLAGIPEDINNRVELTFDNKYDEVQVKYKSEKDGIFMSRSIDLKNKVVDNSLFVIRDYSDFKGKGADVFKDQVEALQKNGYKKITTTAQADEGFNGYYTWAVLGYKPENEKEVMRKFSIKSGTTIYKNFNEVVRTSEGRKLWKKFGFTFDGEFDLKKGSDSVKTLDMYMKTRK